MAKGFRYQTVDFDDIFDPDIMGNGPSTPNLRGPGGTPLRYAALSYGSKRGDIGYRQGGVDVTNLWAQKGSAVYQLPFHGHTAQASAQSPTNAGGNTQAIITLNMLADGTYNITRSGAFVDAPGVIESGTWLPAGQSAGDYQVQFSVSGTAGDTTFSNGASSFVALNANRGIACNLSVVSASSTGKTATFQLNVDFRKGTGTSARSTLNVNLYAQGWQ